MGSSRKHQAWTKSKAMKNSRFQILCFPVEYSFKGRRSGKSHWSNVSSSRSSFRSLWRRFLLSHRSLHKAIGSRTSQIIVVGVELLAPKVFLKNHAHAQTKLCTQFSFCVHYNSCAVGDLNRVCQCKFFQCVPIQVLWFASVIKKIPHARRNKEKNLREIFLNDYFK